MLMYREILQRKANEHGAWDDLSAAPGGPRRGRRDSDTYGSLREGVCGFYSFYLRGAPSIRFSGVFLSFTAETIGRRWVYAPRSAQPPTTWGPVEVTALTASGFFFSLKRGSRRRKNVDSFGLKLPNLPKTAEEQHHEFTTSVFGSLFSSIIHTVLLLGALTYCLLSW